MKSKYENMKNILIQSFLVVLALIIHQTAFAQKYKYGKVTKELLDLSECSFSKDADAMVSYVSGENSVLYSYSQGFFTVLKMKKQIKIFNQNGKEAATNEVIFYSPKGGRGRVKLRGLKGKTYNFENGKIVETKLKDDNVFETQLNNYFKKITFTMPEIQHNSVLEYEYELESEYYTNINDWMLQSEYPVVYNEFYTSMPQYYNYQINITGPFAPLSDVNNTYDENLHIRSGTSNLNSVKVPFNKRKIVFENIPPVEIEAYLANKSDIQAKITHQLILINWPGEMIKKIATDYPNFSKSLLESSSFGVVLKNGDFIKNIIDTKDIKSPLEIAEKVYNIFNEKVKWDGYNHYEALYSGKSLFKEGKGDSGDINLNYIAALNHLGIPTSPVILSTRGSGTLHPFYPDFSDFNYVFALSTIGEKLYFSDATSGLPFGNLPNRCLNGNGWIVSEQGADWIYTKKDFSGRHMMMTEVSFEKNKVILLSNEGRSSYFAFSDFELLKTEEESAFLNKKYNPENVKIDSIIIFEKKPNSIKSRIKSYAEIDDESTKYVYPFELRPFKTNPFKKETRNSIIDFPYLQDYRLVTTIDIQPDEVYEVPQNIHAALDDNSITFKYNSNFNANLKKLTLNVEFKINKNEFLQDEYREIKQSLDIIINKLSEPVVIKKKI